MKSAHLSRRLEITRVVVRPSFLWLILLYVSLWPLLGNLMGRFGVWSTAQKGKNSTLRKFADLITSHNLKVLEEDDYYNGKGDFRLVVLINGKTVCIESKGDPGAGLDVRLKELVTNHNPDIILCTTRTGRSTVYAVSAYSGTYDIIWTSTYQYETNTAIEDQLNATKAKTYLSY